MSRLQPPDSEMHTLLLYVRMIESDLRRILKKQLPETIRERIDAMIEFCTLHTAYCTDAKKYVDRLPSGSAERQQAKEYFVSVIKSFDSHEVRIVTELAALERLLPEHAVDTAVPSTTQEPS